MKMKLSTIFELLLIFIFIAFAASRHVDARSVKRNKIGASLKQAEGAINPYCSCTTLMCNCCRDFALPIVSIKGPGCAAISYKNGDVLRLTMSFGDRVLRNITLVGKRPKPVCMGLPGGISKFCGRLYNIERSGEQFHACLALELRALDDVEAALRVSCFKFGPDGVKLEAGQPIPATKPSEEDDDDDDYDDLDDDDDDLEDDEDDEDNDVDSGDYTGFTALSDELLDSFFGTGGSSSANKKKKKPSTVKPESSINFETIAEPVKEVTTQEPITTTEKVTQPPTSTYPVKRYKTSTTSTTSPATTSVETSEEPVRLTTWQSTFHVTKKPSLSVTSSITTQKPASVSTGIPSIISILPNLGTTKVPIETSNTPPVSSPVKSQNVNGELPVSTKPEEVTTEIDSSPQQNLTKEEEEESESEESTEESEEEEDEKHEDEVNTENEERPSSKSKPAEEGSDESDEETEDDDDGDFYEDEDDEEEQDDDEEDDDNENILEGIMESADSDKEREMRRMEILFPGLTALLKKSPLPKTISTVNDGNDNGEAFPPVRSGRTHRRMRLPPISLTSVQYA